MAWTERYVDAAAAGGGDGTTAATSGGTGAFTLAEAITHSTTNTGVRYNVKNGTYANTTTSRAFSGAGSATAPNWWRGYNTTIGDCDTDPTLTRPSITFTTGACTFTGGHAIFSSISWSSSRTAGSPFASGTATTPIRFIDCLFTATGANSASTAFSQGNSTVLQFLRCGFVATATATSVLTLNPATGSVTMHGCWAEGGATQGALLGAASASFAKCVFWTCGGNGISAASTGMLRVVDCDFYACGSDGIEISNATPSPIIEIVNNTFVSNGGYGILNSSGGNLNLLRQSNFFYSNTSGEESGFGDSPSPSNVSGTASPYLNAASRDMRKTNASELQDKGFPLWWVKNAWPGSIDGTNEFGAMSPATVSAGGVSGARIFTGF